MLNDKLKSFINERHCTILCVGVMSKNVVDSAIELANEYKIPIILIASRRQVETKLQGGGYVCTTEEFVKYVRNYDKGNFIILERDHGGLWQNNFEIEQNYTLQQAMESSKMSFEADIKSGFDIVHIDTSLDIFNNISLKESMMRLFDLYRYCYEFSLKYNKQNLFEIGTEEQSGNIQNIEDLEYIISESNKYCSQHKMFPPTFVVVQTGTKVMELSNIGNFDDNYEKIKEITNICKKHKIFLKQHNTDYLSNESLRKCSELGICFSNVAPEFGVEETKTLIQILEIYKLNDILDKFLKLSYESKKWEKWMIPNSTTTDREKAIISGHYVFSDPRFIDLKNVAIKELKKYNIDLDKELKIQIKNSMMRYLINFNIIKNK